MLGLTEELRQRLEESEVQGLDRHLSPPMGIDFSSNDYLGLRRDENFRRQVLERLASESELTAPASRLLRGHSSLHGELEERLAEFKGFESALLFSTGYQANLGVLSTLIGPQDRVLSDELNHASIIDGLRLARCSKVIFAHRDVAAVERTLATPHSGGRTFLVTESLFSMDGTIAPLGHYARLSQQFGAELIIDEAHAMGLFGRRGSGLVEQFDIAGRVAAVVSTFGKAFGSFGACVFASEVVTRTLINRARSFIFTTSLPPLVLAAVDVALGMVQADPSRRRRVLELAEELRRELRARGVEPLGGEGPIVPVVLGSNRQAMAVAHHLQLRGFDVRAVRPPTVPKGTSRLRISVHADHSEMDLARLAEELAAAPVGDAEIGVGLEELRTSGPRVLAS